MMNVGDHILRRRRTKMLAQAVVCWALIQRHHAVDSEYIKYFVPS
jgi:hypothetical protein